MHINFSPLGNNHGILSIQLEEMDLAPAVKERLKTVRKTAHLKGFRQGTVPESVIQKMYGQAIKDEVVQKMLNDQIQKYQEDHKRRFIGDLLPASENLEQDLKNNLYQFEVGLSPEFDLSASLSATVVPDYQISIPDSLVEEELEQMKERYGPQESILTDQVQEKDLVTIKATQTADPNTTPEEFQTVFDVLLDENCHPSLLTKLLGQSNGFAFVHSIQEVENNLDEQAIRKYLLKLPSDDQRVFAHEFKMELIDIKRKKRAELNEEFFKTLYGPDANYESEEDFRTKVREEIKQYYARECDKILEIKLTKELFSKLNPEYPDAFLKKWLKSEFKEWSEKKENVFDHDLYHFKEGLTWQMIREKVAAEQNFQVTEQDVYLSWINDFRSQYPAFNLPVEQWISMAERALKDKEKFRSAYMNLIDQRCFEWLKSQIAKETKEINLEEFKEIVKQLNSHADHFHEEDHHEHTQDQIAAENKSA
ncbi:MAG: hypothetical protein IPM48_00295 [Saprospiraceae bacterium]|nr:hypothetical protein [Saprospiraceae bacterium]